MYDIIGDIHGHADELVELLELMNYQLVDGVYRHDQRMAVFCGDFIDRGPQIPEVVSIARTMVENGAALSVMGNHEFNALAWHTPNPAEPGSWYRRHSERNQRQHQATLDQFEPDELEAALQWFGTLPVAMDLGTFRVVHACWDAAAIQRLEELRTSIGTAYSSEFLSQTALPNSQLFADVERVLKGPELALPTGHFVTDKEGNRRHRIRIRWFDSPQNRSWCDYALPSQRALPAEFVPQDAPAVPYSADDVPVFVGHYWLPDESARPLTDNVACLDYSIARDGFLTAYRFDGETPLSADLFVAVPSRTQRTAR